MTDMYDTTVDESLTYGTPFFFFFGKKLSNNMEPEEIARVADANWKVHGIDSYVDFADKRIKTGKKSLVRGDNSAILSNVGEDWHIIQNIEVFEFFKEFVITGGMDMDSAGSLNGGQIVWAAAKMNDFSFEIFGGDVVDSYLRFSNPHKYGMSVYIEFISIRLVCSNGMTSLKNRKYKIPHNIQDFKKKSDNIKRGIKETLGMVREDLDEYKKMAKLLASKRYDTDSLRQYYMELFSSTSKAEYCEDLIESQPGAEFARGTWWQAFNSVTYFTDHEQKTTDENRLYSQWYGKNKLLKIRAAKMAEEYAKAA